MKKTIFRILKLIVFLGLGVFLVWMVIKDFNQSQWQHVKEAFLAANYGWLIPVLIVGILSHFIRALRWRLLIKPLNYNPGIRDTFAALMVGYLGNLAFPRLGELMRCGVLSRQDNIPLDKIIGTVVAERTIDVLTLVVIIIVTLLLEIDRVYTLFYKEVWLWMNAVLTWKHIAFVVIGLVVIVFLFWWLMSTYKNTKWRKGLSHILIGIKQGLLSISKLPHKRYFIIYTILIWALYLLMVYGAFQCFSATASLNGHAALSVLTFGSIGMIMTQGGLGAYQLLVEKTLLLYGISQIMSFTYGWFSWLAQTGLVLVLGLAGLVVLALTKRKKYII